MRSCNLIPYENPETGLSGLVVEGTPLNHLTYAAMEGRLIAHDLLEHHSLQSIGGIDDELEALGAVWFVRGLHSLVSERDLVADIERCFEDHCFHQLPYFRPPKTRRHDYDENFQTILEEARASINSFLRDQSDLPDPAPFLDCVIPRLRIGFNRARRRFRNDPPSYLFTTIADAVTPYCERSEPCRLRFNFRGEVHVDPTYD